jgi:hypothetical protein
MDTAVSTEHRAEGPTQGVCKTAIGFPEGNSTSTEMYIVFQKLGFTDLKIEWTIRCYI